MSTTSMMDTPAWTWLRIVLLVPLSGALASCVTRPASSASSSLSPTPTSSTSGGPWNRPTCCDVLASTLGSKVSFPSSNAYNASISSYWSQQESEIAPRCIVSPSSASDVSAALKVLVPRACKFAVRGGGHGAIAGIANIDDGVTIDLGGLSAVTVSSDNKKVKVGGGASWGAVYARLSPLGLAAPGARHATVGVGGSSLGGGFGFFAPKVGFACDNVVQFEVVLANGNIVTASPRTNPNLWRALRGGGNNFGIVTEFTFKTFPLGPMWAGEAYFSASALEAQTQTLYSFTANTNYDLNAGLTVNYAFTPASGPLLTNTYAYAQPVVNPPIFQPFATMAGQLLNNTSVTTLADFSVAQAKESPNGFQEITFATTFENDLGMLRELWAIYTASTNSVANVSGIQWSLSLDPIVPAVVARSDANGGNVLGLRVPAHGLILAVLTATFGSAGDYEIVQAAADKLLADIMEAAKARGVFNPYVDVNHAGKSQDPLASYGLANLAFLKATALHFDPRGVFQTLMPGGFKL